MPDIYSSFTHWSCNKGRNDFMSFNGHFEKYQKTLKLVLLARFTQNENESQQNEGNIRIFLGQLK